MGVWDRMRRWMGPTGDGCSGKAMRIPQLEQLEPRLLLSADLVVTAVAPLPGSVLHEAPAQITVDFSEPLDSASLNGNTFRLRASGGDGSFQDGNEQVVLPAGVVLTGGTQAIMDLTGLVLADDAYEVTLAGDAEWISDRDAELLSMEISGALSSTHCT
jgi:hypothetical protein